MKAIFQRLTTGPDEGFAFKAIRSAGFDCPWHFHPEYELVLVLHGSGYRVVGDNISSLSAGDLVLVGPGLPHFWQDEARPGGKNSVNFMLIQFEERFLMDGILRFRVMAPVKRLLKRSARGLEITGNTRIKVAALMRRMSESTGMERVLQFLQILTTIAASDECRCIASPGFTCGNNRNDQERMDLVLQFLNREIGREIRLSQAAELLHLSDGAFSRFFREHTGKTFPQFVNELRIGKACGLLMSDSHTITDIAYECGFTNLSNFNRQFLRLKGVNPRDFRSQFQERLRGLRVAGA